MLPALHLVVPAYNPGGAFETFLPALVEALSATQSPHRVIVVDDGSSATERRQIVETTTRVAASHPALQPVLGLSHNQGKGAAVRAGWALPGDAAWLGFVDADGSVPASEVVRLWQKAALTGTRTCLIASRYPAPGHTVQKRLHRHLLGRLFARCVWSLLHLPVYDTQCGLKLVPSSAYREISASLQVNRFGFDAELLAFLRAAGCVLAEEPIDWADRGVSTVRLWRDGPAMLMALLQIRRRLPEPGET